MHRYGMKHSTLNFLNEALETMVRACRQGRLICGVALVGFRGRGSGDVVQPDFCYPLVLETLIF